MAIGKRLLVFSPRDPKATSLVATTADWGCLVTTAENVDELRARVEGADFDLVLVEDSKSLRKLISDVDPIGEVLSTSLAHTTFPVISNLLVISVSYWQTHAGRSTPLCQCHRLSALL